MSKQEITLYAICAIYFVLWQLERRRHKKEEERLETQNKKLCLSNEQLINRNVELRKLVYEEHRKARQIPVSKDFILGKLSMGK